MRLSRRALLGVGGMSAASLLVGCGPKSGGPGGGGPEGDITYGFFGNSALQKARLAAVDRFNKTDPGFKVSGLFTPSVDYWTKLATQIAAGTVADVFATQNPYTTTYANKNVMADLGELSDVLDTSNFLPELLKQGAVGGKQVSLPISINARCTIYDADKLKSLGIKIPKSWTWDEYEDIAAEIHDASKGEFAGTEDMGANYTAFELYLRGVGGATYKSATEVGFSREQMGDWFNYWDRLRKAKVAVGANVTAGYKISDWPNSPLIMKKALMQYCASNNVEGIQALSKNTLLLTRPPAPKGQNVDYLGSASYMAISARSQSKRHAAEYLKWLLSSPEAVEVLGLASGPPADTKLTDSLDVSKFSKIDQTEIAYVNQQREADLQPAPTIFPAGAQQAQDLFVRTYQDVAFGRMTIPKAVKSYFDQVPSMLAG